MDPDALKKVAICAIQKNATRYLDEWVHYHLVAVGFDDIYLYDNSDSFESLQAWHRSFGDPYHLKERIHIRHFPGINRQNEAYQHCAKQIQREGSHGWIAFVDIDEFVVVRNTDNYPYISDLLQSLPREYGGLAVNWVQFYMNNQTHCQDLPVTMRFQNRSAEATNRHIKTIARTEYIWGVVNAHHVKYPPFRWWIHTYDTNGNQVDGPFNHAKTTDQISLYHYQTKSLEEYKERCSRGLVDKPKAVWKAQLACKSDKEILRRFAKLPEAIKDDAPWQLLKKHAPLYVNKYV